MNRTTTNRFFVNENRLFTNGMRINQMTVTIITIGSIAAIVGVGVATWSIVSTRKKYYDEYMKRKRGAED